MVDKQRKMFGIIEQWEQSGLAQGFFCQQQGINLAMFGYWRAKYLRERKQGQATGFQEVKLGDEQGLQGEFVFPNGVRLEVRGMDLYLLRRLCLG